MKNSANWIPTKFEQYGMHWRGSRNPYELAISSRITSDAAVISYEIFLHKYARGHLIDFGCGKVPLYGIYKDLVEEITTVDWSQSCHGASFVDIEADLNYRTSLPEDKFDTLLSTSVIEHIRNPSTFFSEVNRILAPDGVAIIATPFLYHLHEVPHDYFRFTEHGLKVLCEENGLEVLEITCYGGLPEVLGDLLSKLFVRPRLVNKLVVAIIQYFLRLRAVKSLSARSKRRFPLGYTIAVRSASKTAV